MPKSLFQNEDMRFFLKIPKQTIKIPQTTGNYLMVYNIQKYFYVTVKMFLLTNTCNNSTL
jgi:hypothetical protein